MITEQQAEEIVLLSYLTQMSIIDAAYAVMGAAIDAADFSSTAELTIEILVAKNKLDREFKATHT